MSNKTICLLETKKMSWINLTKAEEKEINYLKQKFNLHPTDLKECLPPLERPKLVEHPDYLFLILLFPVYNRETRTIKASEVDFFISKNYLITVHNNELPPLIELFKFCESKPKVQEEMFQGNPGFLLYEILNRLLLYCFPMLTHLSNDIDQIEAKIFEGIEREMVSEILLIKRNVVNFRKTMQSQKDILKNRLIPTLPKIINTSRLAPYLENLVEHTKDIWLSLETYSESINALHQTNESLISFRLKQIMKTLTIFSVIIFPLTLIATIFGMNTRYTPLVKEPQGFWIILALMLIGALSMLLIFKHKKWL